MSKEKILNYVLNTPTNSNRSVLSSLLNEFEKEIGKSGGSVPVVTISLSQIISQDPLTLSMTQEQQNIMENTENLVIYFDGSALGFGAIAGIRSDRNAANGIIDFTLFHPATDYNGSMFINYFSYDISTKQIYVYQVDGIEVIDSYELQPKEIVDAGGYFFADTVEGALEEIGATLDGLDAALAALL